MSDYYTHDYNDHGTDYHKLGDCWPVGTRSLPSHPELSMVRCYRYAIGHRQTFIDIVDIYRYL